MFERRWPRSAEISRFICFQVEMTTRCACASLHKNHNQERNFRESNDFFLVLQGWVVESSRFEPLTTELWVAGNPASPAPTTTDFTPMGYRFTRDKHTVSPNSIMNGKRGASVIINPLSSCNQFLNAIHFVDFCFQCSLERKGRSEKALGSRIPGPIPLGI